MIKLSRPSLVFSALLFSAISASVFADTYRLVDAEGNVTYTDKPPQNTSGKVELVTEESAQIKNISDSPETIAQDEPEWLKQARARREAEAAEAKKEQQANKSKIRSDWRQQYTAAKQALKEAELALEIGSEPSDGDFVGNAGGGARPSSQYMHRLESLEQAVADAKRHLEKVKRSKPY